MVRFGKLGKKMLSFERAHPILPPFVFGGKQGSVGVEEAQHRHVTHRAVLILIMNRSNGKTNTTPESSRRLPSSSSASSVAVIRLRVSGLGGHHEIVMSPSSTVLELKSEIERLTSLPPQYQRLVAKRKRMDDDAMVLGGGHASSPPGVVVGMGLEDGAKVMLLHSPLYEEDRDGIGKLMEHIREIDRIDDAMRSGNMDDRTVQELIIQVCCKLDCVETNGSEALRTMRKSTIRRAEGVAHRSEEARKGIDL